MKREYLIISTASLAVGAVAGYFFADYQLVKRYNDLMDVEMNTLRKIADGDLERRAEVLNKAYKEATAAHRFYVGLEPLEPDEEDKLADAKAAEIEKIVLSKEDEPHVQPVEEVEEKNEIVEIIEVAEANMTRSAIEALHNPVVKSKVLADFDKETAKNRGGYVPPKPEDFVYEQPMSAIVPKGGRFKAADDEFRKSLRRNIPGNTDPMPEVGGTKMNGDPQNLHDVSVRLTDDEGAENPKQLERATLTYYAGDNVLADERDKEVEPLIRGMIGQDNLEDLATDPTITTIYLENEKYDRLFEVELSEGSYGEEVAGLPRNPADEPIRRARHGG